MPLADADRGGRRRGPLDPGEAGERFYLIDEGQVEIRRDGVVQYVEGEGGCFGEIALLRDVP